MSVLEFSLVVKEFLLQYWDWYLLIGAIISIIFTRWDYNGWRWGGRRFFIVDLFLVAGLNNIGWAFAYIWNCCFWVVEIYARLIGKIARIYDDPRMK